MVSFRHKGNFSDLTKYFEKVRKAARLSVLEKYGQEGVDALASATPKDSGKTASSWYYEVMRKGSTASIVFKNSNANNGVPIAIILQYGHGTRNGGWVEGRDYINPAIQPVFDKIADAAWKEVANI